jgi:hypothetical protein
MGPNRPTQKSGPESNPMTTYVVPDDQQDRIKAEEVFREEVRSDLAAKRKKSKTEFLNSPFCIFLLSIILVNGVSFLYTQNIESSKQSQIQAERRDRIATEIDFRCALFAQANLPIDKVRIINGQSPKGLAYDEFGGTKLYSLLVELRPLVQQPAIKKQIAALSIVCRSDLEELDEAKLKDVASKAETIAKVVLPK